MIYALDVSNRDALVRKLVDLFRAGHASVIVDLAGDPAGPAWWYPERDIQRVRKSVDDRITYPPDSALRSSTKALRGRSRELSQAEGRSICSVEFFIGSRRNTRSHDSENVGANATLFVPATLDRILSFMTVRNEDAILRLEKGGGISVPVFAPADTHKSVLKNTAWDYLTALRSRFENGEHTLVGEGRKLGTKWVKQEDGSKRLALVARRDRR